MEKLQRRAARIVTKCDSSDIALSNPAFHKRLSQRPNEIPAPQLPITGNFTLRKLFVLLSYVQHFV